MNVATVSETYAADASVVTEQFLALQIPWNALNPALKNTPYIDIVWLQGTVFKTAADPIWLYTDGIYFRVQTDNVMNMLGFSSGLQAIVLQTGTPFMPHPIRVPVKSNSSLFLTLGCTFGEHNVALLDTLNFRITLGYNVPEYDQGERGAILDPIKVWDKEKKETALWSTER